MSATIPEPYRPSNGTEADAFVVRWCTKCARDKPSREGVDYQDCGPDEICEILTDAGYAGEAQEWVRIDGVPTCTAFIPAGQPIPIKRCDKTPDMFGGKADERLT